MKKGERTKLNRELFEQNYKICSICDKKLDISNFNKQKKGQNGLHSECNNCLKKRWEHYRLNNLFQYSEHAKKRRKEKKEESKIYDKQFRHIYHNNINGCASRLYSSSKRRSQLKKIEFNLTNEWIKSKLQLKKCEATGFDLTFETSDYRVHPLRPTLDRIDNLKGYTLENTRVVCWWWNIAKADWTDEILINLINKYKEYGKK